MKNIKEDASLEHILRLAEEKRSAGGVVSTGELQSLWTDKESGRCIKRRQKPFVFFNKFQLLWRDLVSFISVRSDSTVVEVLLSWFTARLIISFVMSSLGSTGTSSFAFSIDFLSFGSAEVVLLTFAPVLIMVDKGIQGHFTDTVHMPVCRCKINPFLAAVTACEDCQSKYSHQDRSDQGCR